METSMTVIGYNSFTITFMVLSDNGCVSDTVFTVLSRLTETTHVGYTASSTSFRFSDTEPAVHIYERSKPTSTPQTTHAPH